MASSPKFSDYALPGSIVLASIILGAAIFFAPNSVGLGGVVYKSGAQAPAAQNQPSVGGQAQNVDVKNVKTAGEPYIGQTNAPVVIAYWYDYQCPFCKQGEQVLMPQIIKDYVQTGKIRVVFKDFQFLGADSQTLGLASHAVWQVNPGKFYAWHKAMFDNQGRENTGWATLDKIKSITLPVLGASDTDRVMGLMDSNKAAFTAAMNADKSEGGTFGVKGTPSFVIGKQLIVGAQPYERIKAAIDAALK